jgi:hypothetical protein
MGLKVSLAMDEVGAVTGATDDAGSGDADEVGTKKDYADGLRLERGCWEIGVGVGAETGATGAAEAAAAKVVSCIIKANKLSNLESVAAAVVALSHVILQFLLISFQTNHRVRQSFNQILF